jgi:hypothetical protein
MEHDEVGRRIAILSEPWWEERWIEEHYGIRFPARRLVGSFLAWGHNRTRPLQVAREGKLDRHAFESYLQAAQWIPMKWAAARLGMTPSSFEAVVARMVEKGLDVHGVLDIDGRLDPQLILEVAIQNFRDHFPALQNMFVVEYQIYCERLHAAIREDLDFEVEPLRCITSEKLREEPIFYAHEYDAVTLEPVGLHWQVWLDFGKPINLYPDVCATSTYAEHEALIESKLYAGQQPRIPDQLGQAHSA